MINKSLKHAWPHQLCGQWLIDIFNANSPPCFMMFWLRAKTEQAWNMRNSKAAEMWCSCCYVLRQNTDQLPTWYVAVCSQDSQTNYGRYKVQGYCYFFLNQDIVPRINKCRFLQTNQVKINDICLSRIMLQRKHF